MTAAELANLHAAVFTVPRPYSEQEFSDFLSDANCLHCWLEQDGFALGRLIGDEAELLTIAVAPDLQGRGIGRVILGDFEATASLRGARCIYLEVAENNAAAIALYQSAGYGVVGRRVNYYRSKNGAIDALTMARDL